MAQNQQEAESSFSSGMKMALGAAFAIFFVIPLLLCGTCGGCSVVLSEFGKSVESAREGSSGPGAGGAEKEVKTFELGQGFNLGNFSYNVSKVQVTDEVGNDIVGETAGKSAKFLVVWFVVRNNGKKTQTVLTNDFKLATTQGRTYSPSSNANTALATSYDDKDILLTQLQPGLEKTTATVFKVPVEVTESTFFVTVPDKAFLSSAKVRVKVTPEALESR